MAKNETLKKAIESIKLSRNILQSDIALAVGVKNTYLSDVINGRVPLSDNLAEKFYEQFQIDKSWLLTGEGEMLKNSGQSSGDIPTINYERKGVPYYDVDFIGGFDLVLNDQTVNPEYYVNFKQYNNADYWVNVSGHSMEPEVAHGDMIAIKELNNWPIHILYGEMYAIVTTENRTVKYVRKSTKGEDWLRLVPVNVSEYDDQDIPKSVIMKVFKVLGCTKRIQ